MKTVACLIPLSWEVVPRQFFFSFSAMLMYSQGKYHMLMLTARGASIANMHEKMVEAALKANVDYIFHVDADEVYPNDTPERLMKHIDDGKDVVFGLVLSNAQDGYVAYEFQENPLKLVPSDIKPNSGIVEVGCTGMGGLMVNPKVYEKLDKPYFTSPFFKHAPDTSLCYQCKQKGIKMWVDTDLHYGHIVPHVKYPQ